ncbi:MAG: HNH nuclease family protein [Desulfuromonadales bacterium]|nr:MAG: HNH nuclease family protein [Desulfuromonadales bacterium]
MWQTFRPRRPQKPTGSSSQTDLDDLVRRMKAEQSASGSYREQSLKIHGWICAKCGREFELNNLHLLTVHHRDGNHDNNPKDGSNWENLCTYCHDDEHSRSQLGDYFLKERE